MSGATKKNDFSTVIARYVFLVYVAMLHMNYPQSLSANWNNITSFTQVLSNDLENIEKWSTENKMSLILRRLKRHLLREKGYNISLVRKQPP